MEEIKKERKFDGKKPERRERAPRREESDITKKLICVNRVCKTTKGGRDMKFAALVAVGDGKGNVGIGMGKSREVPSAIDKATSAARKNMKFIRVVNGTIPHETIGKFGTTKILMFPAKEGTGVIAGGSARAVLELAGIKDIVTKIHGSTNKINCVKATFNGLTSMRSKEQIAAMRGIPVEEI